MGSEWSLDTLKLGALLHPGSAQESNRIHRNSGLAGQDIVPVLTWGSRSGSLVLLRYQKTLLKLATG